MKTLLTERQVIPAAFADLCGAYENWVLDECPDSYHDWDAHYLTITEMVDIFDYLEPPAWVNTDTFAERIRAIAGEHQ